MGKAVVTVDGASFSTLEGYRTSYEAWAKEVGPTRIWAEAEKL